MTNLETKVMFEDFNSKIDAILEIVRPLANLPARVDRIESRLDGLEGDMRIVKAAVTDISQEVKHHTKIFEGFARALAVQR